MNSGSGDVGRNDKSKSNSTITSAQTKGSVRERLLKAVSAEAFDQWYREREFARNIREGTSYFNGPGRIKPPRRHSPSSLLQCHRKIAYNQLNAPEETEDPSGIFWIGSRFEEEIALPFLQSRVVGHDEYVTNSIWVDFTVKTDAGRLRIKGETDPVIVDSEAEPLLLTEIKTKQTVKDIQSPNNHHRAQAHAYMKGLSEKYNRDITKALILYGGRQTLDIRPFEVEFSPWFWRNTVANWAATHTTFRVNVTLPPADPEYDWECEFCSFRERCGKGNSGYVDAPEHGLLPGLQEYPRKKVVEYLKATEDARLTPTLAYEYPQLATDYEVCPWRCKECHATFAWETIDFENTSPVCPVCADNGTLAELFVENAVEYCSAEHEKVQLTKQGEEDE